MPFEELRNNLLNIADKTMKHAKDLGIPSAEAFVYKESVSNLSENRGKIDSRSGIVQGVGIRVAEGKKIGFSSVTGFSDDGVKKALQNAFAIAKSSPENDYFPGFVAESKMGKDGILDTEVANTNVENLSEDITELMSKVDLSDKRIVGLSTNVLSQWGGYAVGTTEGCLVSTVYSFYGCMSSAVIMDQSERKTGTHMDFGRKVFDTSEFGQEAINKGMKCLGAQKFEGTDEMDVVFHPRTAADFYGFPIMVGSSGAGVVQKRNPFADKLKQKVATENLTIADDGQMEDGLATVAIDSEGTMVRRNEIIKDGILEGFLFNRLYGHAYGTESTGNGLRTGMGGGGVPFERTPTVSPHKLVITPGVKNLDEQIAECEKGIYVEGSPIGLHTSNLLTGDFSVTSNNAFLIEKGEIKYPLKNISLAGNFYKMFNDTLFVGSDLQASPQIMNSPSMTVKNITISA